MASWSKPKGIAIASVFVDFSASRGVPRAWLRYSCVLEAMHHHQVREHSTISHVSTLRSLPPAVPSDRPEFILLLSGAYLCRLLWRLEGDGIRYSAVSEAKRSQQ